MATAQRTQYPDRRCIFAVAAAARSSCELPPDTQAEQHGLGATRAVIVSEFAEERYQAAPRENDPTSTR
ncbi:hypothetical protein AC579_9474 [Pseudocercospora musae]|uniref:Uncharacterized protein n=1 Tax=Pseudocercospora musae TaxID=113226 RepID=A0A139I9J6_9PEZI|nr:hypothetical protein AC579_9474 [Pseudocercospora musae]